MLRYHAPLTGLLASLLVVPAFLGQGQIATLQDALNGTLRALEVLKGLEQRLREEPAAALGLVLSATEPPVLDQAQNAARLDALRNEVSLLQMELDAMQSPVLSRDGAVQSALGGSTPSGPALEGARPALPAGITTGLDDSLRALLTEAPTTRTVLRAEPGREGGAVAEAAPSIGAEDAYTADPLRHGITCYRAGRYAEAYALLRPLDGATALYWQARTLERLERLDEAVAAMERAIEKGGAGFEQRRAQTDLEFLRWKRDFVASMPASGRGKERE
jgi:hypothetical protein